MVSDAAIVARELDRRTFQESAVRTIDAQAAAIAQCQRDLTVTREFLADLSTRYDAGILDMRVTLAAEIERADAHRHAGFWARWRWLVLGR